MLRNELGCVCMEKIARQIDRLRDISLSRGRDVSWWKEDSVHCWLSALGRITRLGMSCFRSELLCFSASCLTYWSINYSSLPHLLTHLYEVYDA